MGVRTIVGMVDGTRKGAAMYDSVTGWTVGPIWEAEDAPEQIEAFLEWVRTLRFVEHVDEILLNLGDLPTPHDGSDVRHWPDSGLGKLVVYWRREHLDEDGLLKVELAAG